MPTLEQPQQCSGCFACAAACARNAIAVGKDAEGFAIPVVDEKLCVECGACETACAGRLSYVQKPRAAFAFAANSDEVLGSSASGGAFACLATWWLEHDGVVFAVAEEDGRAALREVRSKDRLAECLGSKYYQASFDDTCIHRVRDLLGKGIRVLFAGTPCQVAAVSSCVPERNRGGLLLVDLICQGVPSYDSVAAYREEASRKHGSKLIEHRFRAKDPQRLGRYMTELRFADGTTRRSIGGQDICSRAFMYNLFLRESCYRCEYAGARRPGDITLGDFWGYPFSGSFKPGATSLVLCNTDKGASIAAELGVWGALAEADVDAAIAGNVPLRHPVKRPMCRSFAYGLLKAIGYSKAVGMLTWKYALKRLLRKERVDS